MRGPCTVQELLPHVSVGADTLCRSLMALTVPGVFTYEAVSAKFANTAVARTMLVQQTCLHQGSVMAGGLPPHTLRNTTSEEECVELLRKQPGSHLFASEYLLTDGDAGTVASISDAQLMLEGPPGRRERTEEQYRCLFEKAGWEFVGVKQTPSPLVILEGKKRI